MTSPTPNVVNMETAARLIREAKEAREARRKARDEKRDEPRYPTAADDTWNPKAPYPGGIDDLEV